MEDAAVEFPTLVGVLGGIAGIGAALVGTIQWIYRRGYERGREVERARHQNHVIERLSKELAERK